jgi:hypothetical protein
MSWIINDKSEIDSLAIDPPFLDTAGHYAAQQIKGLGLRENGYSIFENAVELV